MISHTTERFRRAFRELPPEIRQQARKAYALFQQDPYHPSLRFKLVHPTRPVYSVRITRGYRALGIREEDTLIWFWIGSHTDYEKLIAQR